MKKLMGDSVGNCLILYSCCIRNENSLVSMKCEVNNFLVPGYNWGFSELIIAARPF